LNTPAGQADDAVQVAFVEQFALGLHESRFVGPEQNATTQMAHFAIFCQHAIVLPETEAIFDLKEGVQVCPRGSPLSV
jgi:hypothetical protein